MQDAGVTRPAAQNIDDFTSEISEENIPDAEGDYIFVTTSVGEDGNSVSTSLDRRVAGVRLTSFGR